MQPICPLFNGPCPGAENCAPARYSVFVDDEGTSHYRCPISNATDCLQALAFSMEPFVHGLIGSPPQKQPSIDEIGREKFIADIVRPDQRGDG